MRTPNVVDLMIEERYFGRWLGGDSWLSWRVLLKGVFCLPMTEEEREIFRRHTDREPPASQPREVWVLVGRRGGKSTIGALLGTHYTCCKDFRAVLNLGERAASVLVAENREQARIVFRRTEAMVDEVQDFAGLIEDYVTTKRKRRSKALIDFSNGTSLEVVAADHAGVRSRTVALGLLDEVCFWPTTEQSANPDKEVIASLKPSMLTVPGAILWSISSPHSKRGEMYEAHRQHFGKDDDVLCWNADTLSMNPLVPKEEIERAFEEDPQRAMAEYGRDGRVAFRSDLESYVSREAVESIVVSERHELPPAGLPYVAFVDPSGGSQDSFTIAIAHQENGKGVVDAVRERRPPFSPDEVTAEFAHLALSYGIQRVVGDKYAGEWPRERFREHGVMYDPAGKTKSEIYGELLPLVNSGRVELLDHPRLLTQLVALERRQARGGRSTIDHPPGTHDDLANAAAGALVEAVQGAGEVIVFAEDLGSRISPDLDELGI